MTSEIPGWVIEFRGCTEKVPDCHFGQFEVAQQGARAQQVEVALSNAMGLGGHNGCVMVARWRD